MNDPRILKWLGKVVGVEGDDLSRHDKWLCMMYPRIKFLYQLLSEDGSIWISIDDNECHSLKLMLDEIFGAGISLQILSGKKEMEPQMTGNLDISTNIF